MVERTVCKNPTSMVVSFRNRAGELGMGKLHAGYFENSRGGYRCSEEVRTQRYKVIVVGGYVKAFEKSGFVH